MGTLKSFLRNKCSRNLHGTETIITVKFRCLNACIVKSTTGVLPLLGKFVQGGLPLVCPMDSIVIK